MLIIDLLRIILNKINLGAEIFIPFKILMFLYFLISHHMILRSWEYLWKALATIGLANIVIFLMIIFFTNMPHSSYLIWVFTGIESACYIGVVLVRRHIVKLLR
jgi:hypothetical protein